MLSDRMLISILSMSVEQLEMPCAEAADVLGSWVGAEDLPIASDVCLLEVKFILNLVLPFRISFAAWPGLDC